MFKNRKITIWRKSYIYPANSYYNIVDINDETKEYHKALDYFEKALKIRTCLLGDNHNDTCKLSQKIFFIKEKLKHINI
jgi:hypothetical protein